MPTLDEIRERFSRDRFATATTGVVIKEAEPGRAVCVLDVEERHLNANDVPMGGAIFTVADLAFAVATNAFAEDVMTVARDSQITFLSPAKGKTLIAEATEVRSGKRMCFYQIDVTDELGTFVARMTANGSRIVIH